MNNLTAPIDEKVVRDLTELAVRAPSAENTQPWRVEWSGEDLIVRHDRSRAMASDVDSMLDLTGIGAFIESMVIAASDRGICAEVHSAADPAEASNEPSTIVAAIRLSGGADRDDLASQLAARCTTRRMSPKPPLTDEERRALSEAAGRFSGVQLEWVSPESIPGVARLIGLGNRIRFEHEPFHEEFYANMRFSPQEARDTRDGLDVATLQLPCGVASVLRFLRFWPRMQFANRLGFSRFVAKQAAEEVESSAAVGLLSVEAPNADQFLAGGRTLQRVWLEATRLGLAFHPTASLPVFVGYAKSKAAARLPLALQNAAAEMAKQLDQLMPHLNSRTLQMAFRVGHGEAPSTRTLRRPAALMSAAESHVRQR